MIKEAQHFFVFGWWAILTVGARNHGLEKLDIIFLSNYFIFLYESFFVYIHLSGQFVEMHTPANLRPQATSKKSLIINTEPTINNYEPVNFLSFDPLH